MKKWNIRTKIILSTLLCVFFVSIFGNLILYLYMRGIISRQRNEINRIYLSTLSSDIQTHIDNGTDLVLQCANDPLIIKSLTEDSYSLTHVEAQRLMDNFLAVFPDQNYVLKLIAFNKNGLMVQSSSQSESGFVDDSKHLMQSQIFQNLQQNPGRIPHAILIDSPLVPYETEKLAMGILCPTFHSSSSVPGYIYLELDLELFRQILSPYAEENHLFLTSSEQVPITPLPPMVSADSLFEAIASGEADFQGHTYRFLQRDLPVCGLSLYLCYSSRLPGTGSQDLIFPFFIVFLMVLILSFILVIITSHYISRPISLLKNRLKRISENDFSFDPAIEKSGDEFGLMGKVINEMTLSIKHLLDDIEQMYEKRKNIELSLLQSQVNPHFLYNTLDSIRWMAVIQKNTGIAQMAQRLVNLLRNLAKGTQDKIPLREELALLEDYIEIQNIRYVETFSFENRVPQELLDLKILKFTLQPLVENAIFHGIEPTGRFGTIILSATIEDNDLLLSVEDDGIGIPADKLDSLLTSSNADRSTSLNGIGIGNVNQRLQLLYGRRYGLTAESEEGRFTRITVRIPVEQDAPPSPGKETN